MFIYILQKITWLQGPFCPSRQNGLSRQVKCTALHGLDSSVHVQQSLAMCVQSDMTDSQYNLQRILNRKPLFFLFCFVFMNIFKAWPMTIHAGCILSFIYHMYRIHDICRLFLAMVDEYIHIYNSWIIQLCFLNTYINMQNIYDKHYHL